MSFQVVEQCDEPPPEEVIPPPSSPSPFLPGVRSCTVCVDSLHGWSDSDEGPDVLDNIRVCLQHRQRNLDAAISALTCCPSLTSLELLIDQKRLHPPLIDDADSLTRIRTLTSLRSLILEGFSFTFPGLQSLLSLPLSHLDLTLCHVHSTRVEDVCYPPISPTITSLLLPSILIPLPTVGLQHDCPSPPARPSPLPPAHVHRLLYLRTAPVHVVTQHVVDPSHIAAHDAFLTAHTSLTALDLNFFRRSLSFLVSANGSPVLLELTHVRAVAYSGVDELVGCLAAQLQVLDLDLREQPLSSAALFECRQLRSLRLRKMPAPLLHAEASSPAPSFPFLHTLFLEGDIGSEAIQHAFLLGCPQCEDLTLERSSSLSFDVLSIAGRACRKLRRLRLADGRGSLFRQATPAPGVALPAAAFSSGDVSTSAASSPLFPSLVALEMVTLSDDRHGRFHQSVLSTLVSLLQPSPHLRYLHLGLDLVPSEVRTFAPLTQLTVLDVRSVRGQPPFLTPHRQGRRPMLWGVEPYLTSEVVGDEEIGDQVATLWYGSRKETPWRFVTEQRFTARDGRQGLNGREAYFDALPQPSATAADLLYPY